jgi:hypothetical protein
MSLKTPTSSVQPMRTMQPTSMATMLEAREKVLSEVTRPGMESPPSPGRPAVSYLCPAISYSRYRLFPTPTGLLKRPLPSRDSQQPHAIVLHSSTWLTQSKVSGYGCQNQVSARFAESSRLISSHCRASGNPLRLDLRASKSDLEDYVECRPHRPSAMVHNSEIR